MKIFAPSLRGGPTCTLVAGLAILLGGACAGKGGSGPATGGSGGSPTGGSSTGGSPTGGSSTGGSPTGGSGSGGSATGGAAGVPGSGGNATGGAVGTGGAASGGATGDGGGGGSGHCGARPGLLFCDDFESDAPGLPPATPWTTSIIGSGTVTVDGSDPAASGTKSIHIQDDSDYDTLLALHDTTILPSTTGRLYVRFYIRLAAAMTAGHNSFVLGDLFASPGDSGSLRFSEDNQMFAESIGGDAQGAMSNNNFYNDHQIGPGLTAGQWACVELLLDHATPEIDVWLNGAEIPDLKSTAWAIDAYDYLRFGFEKYAGPGSEIWYDDIALGTQPIGCN